MPSLLLLLPLPHLHPLQPPHRSKSLVMARKKIVEAEKGVLPSQSWGEGEESLDLPSVSTTQDKGCQMPSLPCAYCTGKQPPKQGLRNVSLALFWPLVASACPHTPAQPCCDCWSFYPWVHSSQLGVCSLGVWEVSGCGTVLMQLENCS